MKNCYLLILCIVSLLLGACSKDDGDEAPGINYSEFSVINNGGAVDKIDAEQYGTIPLEIVQTIPSFDSWNFSAKLKSQSSGSRSSASTPALKAQSAADNTFPANIPIMFFFNNIIYSNSIENNFVVTVGGTEVKGTIVVNVSPQGNAIITFTPWTEFATDKEITVTINKEMQSGGGIGMLEDLALKYVTSQSVKGNFDSNKGFEKGDEGVFFVGDGAVRTGTTGPLAPYEGDRFAAISSGECIVSENGYAVGSASSLMVLGPINTNISTLNFYYDFISA